MLRLSTDWLTCDLVRGLGLQGFTQLSWAGGKISSGEASVTCLDPLSPCLGKRSEWSDLEVNW